ncbi:MAG TPA: class D sortase [Candidatus Acidoferrum sp.]
MNYRNKVTRVLRGFERLLFILGLLLIFAYLADRIYITSFTRGELKTFSRGDVNGASAGTSNALPQVQGNPDFRLWSDKRIAAFKTNLSNGLARPLAVLKIPSIDLEVQVLEGTDDLTLNRGLGHIIGTAAPGGDGNIGIAGHRDGFFRGLKDIHQGTTIELFAPNKNARYLVDEVLIVDPEDVFVLRPRSKPSLTLVTCYPFYFVGSAPRRYIVHATIENQGQLEDTRQ